MLVDEEIQTLTGLGLSSLQAKVYLTLLTLENGTMRSISKSANIARQDAYRILPTLQKLGLAKKLISKPTMYEATSMKDGVAILLQQRKEEHERLQKKTSMLLEKLQESQSPAMPPNDDSQFGIIYDRTLLLQKFARENQTAKKSIDCSGTWPDIKILMSMCNCKNDLFTNANKRGVKIRIITEDRGSDKEVDENMIGMSQNPLFCIRFLQEPMPVKIVLYDDQEVNTSISTSADTDMPSLWSNNPSFVRIMKNQFNEMWRRASPLKV
jgi:sugar-specific transcriptional regulator TrmB